MAGRKQISSTKTRPISISLSEGQWTALGRLANHHGVSVSAVVKMLMAKEYESLGYYWSDSLDTFVTVPEK